MTFLAQVDHDLGYFRNYYHIENRTIQNVLFFEYTMYLT